MNDQLQKALAEIISKASSGIDTSISFLSAELPDVVHQVLIWNGIESAIKFLFFAICAAIAIRSAAKYEREHGVKVLRDAYDRGDSWTRTRYEAVERSAKHGKFIRVSLSFALSLLALSHITWVQILVAPKLYLIEYAATLVK